MIVRNGNPVLDRKACDMHQKTGWYLEKQFEKFNTGDIKSDIRWLKTEMTMPSFSDLIFIWKNAVFVIIPLDASRTIVLPPKDSRVLPRMIDVATKNNLIPCIFPIWESSSKCDGFNLFDAREYLRSNHLKKIDVVKLSKCAALRMSDWELYNFAISRFLIHIKEKGLEIASFQDVPEINPQVFFYDRNKRLSWAYIRTRINGKAEAWDPSLKEMDINIGYTAPYDGNAYYVTVDIRTKDGKKPFRNDVIDFELDDISPSL